MKLYILILGLLYIGIADSRTRYKSHAKAPPIEITSTRAQTIVWAEILSLDIEHPKSEKENVHRSITTNTLEELLALVKNCRTITRDSRPTILLSLNPLHLIKGNPVELQTRCEECPELQSILLKSMSVGKKYILFYKNNILIRTIEADTTERFQDLTLLIENSKK